MIRDLIRREGPVPFDVYMEAVLYGEGGFFSSGRGVQRDFVTSPEVGSLFGLCVARRLDEYWRALGDPDPFLVIEAGAGNGRLAQSILRAAPDCVRAMRYVCVERSDALRAEQRTRLPLEPPEDAIGPFLRISHDDAPVPAPNAGPVVTALAEMPAIEATGVVVIANELLDNLPFGIAHYDGERWSEVRVGLDGDRLVEVLVPMPDPPAVDVAPGARVPIPRALPSWFATCESVVRHGFVVAIDYMTDRPELRLRTYRGHERSDDPLVDPGSLDITADVVVDHVLHAASGFALVEHTTQADWLRAAGIDQLADAGAQRWREGAHRGDLDALAGRSFVHEAAVLTDLAGLGAHHVLVLQR